MAHVCIHDSELYWNKLYHDACGGMVLIFSVFKGGNYQVAIDVDA